MKSVVTTFLLIVIWTGSALANLSVAPIIFDTDDIQKGTIFEVLCQHEGEQELHIELSLALFDQDNGGGIRLLEDSESKELAEQILRLNQHSLVLEPKGKQMIQLEVLREDFDHAYVVLFVGGVSAGIPTRLAVLFLLSTGKTSENIAVTTWHPGEQRFEITVSNEGKRHGLWRGELLCFDAKGNLGERLQIETGIVLAGRSRGVEVNLPSWVHSVELIQLRAGIER